MKSAWRWVHQLGGDINMQKMPCSYRPKKKSQLPQFPKYLAICRLLIWSIWSNHHGFLSFVPPSVWIGCNWRLVLEIPMSAIRAQCRSLSSYKSTSLLWMGQRNLASPIWEGWKPNKIMGCLPSIRRRISQRTIHSYRSTSVSGNFRILNWRYLPYIRPMFQAYVSEYP